MTVTTSCENQKLNGVNEGFFDAVEDDGADEKDHEHESGAVGQAQPGGVAGAQKSCPEGFNDRCDGVYIRHPAPILRNAGHRVDDWRGIHPQANSKAYQVLQIAIFCGHGGDDDAKAQPEPSHQHQKYWQREGPGREPDIRTAQSKEGKIGKEEGKLDGKSDQVGNDDRYWHHQAWEVDLSKEMGIRGKGGGGAGETA